MKNVGEMIEEDAKRFALEMDLRIQSLEKALIDISRQQDAINLLLLDQVKKGYYDPSNADRLLSPSQMRYSMDAIPPTAGNLHPLEVSKDGAVYRWTGPGSVVELPIVIDRRNSYQAKLHIVAVAAQSVMDSSAVYIDDVLVESKLEGKYISFPIPSDGARYGEATVKLVTGECIVPANIQDSMSKDTRKLGMAISFLEIK